MSDGASQTVFSEDQYLAVPTASLIHQKASLSDLFLRLTTNRMIKIAHKGGAIDLAQIARLGEKDVQYLYVRRGDFSSIVSSLVRGVELLNQIKNVPVDLKLVKFFDIAESVYVDLLKLPVSDESLGRAIRLSQEISKAVREKPDFMKLVKIIVDMGDEFTRHSIGTVIMTNMLATQLAWNSPKLLDPLTMGAFFHDIGLKEIPEELRFRNRIEMDKDQALLWESHTGRGVQLLSALPFVTPEVLRIVQEHHEIPNGQGFPGKLRLDRIFPMAKAVSFANIMAHDVFDNVKDGQFNMGPMTQKIEHVYSVMFGSDLTRAARRMFKSSI